MGSVSHNPRPQVNIGNSYGLASAVLFGASTPLCKLLLPGIGPLMLAALLYLGAAILIAAYRTLSVLRRRPPVEAKIRASDAPALCVIVGFGGVLGPILMLFGLARISALTGSLLLNLEAVFTMVFAVFIFREHLNRRSAIASAFVVTGALLLSYQPGPMSGGFLGILAIVGACISWAIDNNVSQRLSLRDPVAVVQVKSAGAGITSLMLALATGYGIPSPALLVGALVLGSFSYGASLICVMLALRHLGAAREAAWFSTAPFVGAMLSIRIFGVRPTAWEMLGMIAMVAGVYLLVGEQHSHIHIHEEIEHDHSHVHDEHHRHTHVGGVSQPHSHLHRHDPLIHEHPHVSDVHHLHRHA